MPAQRLGDLQLGADVVHDPEELAEALRPVLLRGATQLRVSKLAQQLQAAARLGLSTSMHALGCSPYAAGAFDGTAGGKLKCEWLAERLRRHPDIKPAIDAAFSTGLFGQDGSGIYTQAMSARIRQIKAGLQMPSAASATRTQRAIDWHGQEKITFNQLFRDACAEANIVPDTLSFIHEVLPKRPGRRIEDPAALEEAAGQWVQNMETKKPGFAAMITGFRSSSGATALDCAKAYRAANDPYSRRSCREVKSLAS